MKFDVELICLPARIKVKFAPEPEPLDIFTFKPRVKMDDALAWFDEQIKARLEGGKFEQYLKLSLNKEMYKAGIAGLPEDYPYELWPEEKYTPELTPFQKANLNYRTAYNNALKESEWSKEKRREVFDTIGRLINGGVYGIDAASEGKPYTAEEVFCEVYPKETVSKTVEYGNKLYDLVKYIGESNAPDKDLTKNFGFAYVDSNVHNEVGTQHMLKHREDLDTLANVIFGGVDGVDAASEESDP